MGYATGMDLILAHDEAHKAKLRAAIESGAPVTYNQFARLTGTTEPSVRRAWVDGALPSLPGDCIPIREGIVALCAIPGALRKGPKDGCPVWLLEFDALARSLLGLPPREQDASLFAPTSPGAAASSVGDDDELRRVRVAHLRAQTAHALQGAKAREFDLSVKRGEYVRTADVELDAAECATNVIAVLQSLPARIGAACVGLSALEIERRAAAEIDKAIKHIQNAAMTGDWS